MSGLPFAVHAENRLKSHRWPSPLFEEDFHRLRGCMYHLGSPELKDPTYPYRYTASALLEEWWEALRFKPEFRGHVRRLLEDLLGSSPEGKLVFTSDYQFGPSPRRYRRPRTLDEFWELHDTGRLRANALYVLVRECSAQDPLGTDPEGD